MRAQRVCKLPERVRNGRAEAFRLHQHSDKLPHKIDVNSLRHAAPGIQTRFSSTLLTIDDLEFIGQSARGQSYFLANSHHCLVNTQAGLHADHQ